MVATSYWPAWLEKSWVILSRTSFSGSTVKLTLMPVDLVKLAAVSFCRSSICGLFTISTLMEWPPELPPEPPAPEQAASSVPQTASASGGSRRCGLLVLGVMMRPFHDRDEGG
jgi:hypothetical protein